MDASGEASKHTSSVAGPGYTAVQPPLRSSDSGKPPQSSPIVVIPALPAASASTYPMAALRGCFLGGAGRLPMRLSAERGMPCSVQITAPAGLADDHASASNMRTCDRLIQGPFESGLRQHRSDVQEGCLIESVVMLDDRILHHSTTAGLPPWIIDKVKGMGELPACHLDRSGRIDQGGTGM